jgi:hypothetical protein
MTSAKKNGYHYDAREESGPENLKMSNRFVRVALPLPIEGTLITAATSKDSFTNLGVGIRDAIKPTRSLFMYEGYRSCIGIQDLRST